MFIYIFFHLCLFKKYIFTIEKYVYWYIYITGVGSGGGGKGASAPHFFDWGGNGMFVPPTFNPTFLFSTWIIRLYNTDKQLFGIFHISINYLVDNFNKLIQMAVIK